MFSKDHLETSHLYCIARITKVAVYGNLETLVEDVHLVCGALNLIDVAYVGCVVLDLCQMLILYLAR